jgi:hypothetical protein
LEKRKVGQQGKDRRREEPEQGGEQRALGPLICFFLMRVNGHAYNASRDKLYI